MGRMRGLGRYAGATVRVHIRGGETIEGRLRGARRNIVTLENVVHLHVVNDQVVREGLDGRLLIEVPAGSLVQVLTT